MSVLPNKLLRSLLYVPANSDKFIQKAHERGADAIILDLEDSVVEDQKKQARSALKEAIPIVSQNGATVFVRVNSTGPHHLEDIKEAVAAGAHGLIIPKVVTSEQIDKVIDETKGYDLMIVAVIETAKGMLNARSIAAHPSICALILGAEDFSTDIGASSADDVIRLPKLLVHYAAKSENKLSLGMLRSTIKFNDDGLTAAAEEAVRYGFDGATCIHPKAIPILNTAFSPSKEDIIYAQRVVAAARKAKLDGVGAFMLDGKFIDAPIISRAIVLLAKAGCSEEVN